MFQKVFRVSYFLIVGDCKSCLSANDLNDFVVFHFFVLNFYKTKPHLGDCESVHKSSGVWEGSHPSIWDSPVGSGMTWIHHCKSRQVGSIQCLQAFQDMPSTVLPHSPSLY